MSTADLIAEAAAEREAICAADGLSASQIAASVAHTRAEAARWYA